MITYYGKARNLQGRIEQVLVTKEPGRPTSRQWTGKYYRTDRHADADIAALNCEIARQPRRSPTATR